MKNLSIRAASIIVGRKKKYVSCSTYNDTRVYDSRIVKNYLAFLTGKGNTLINNASLVKYVGGLVDNNNSYISVHDGFILRREGSDFVFSYGFPVYNYETKSWGTQVIKLTKDYKEGSIPGIDDVKRVKFLVDRLSGCSKLYSELYQKEVKSSGNSLKKQLNNN